MNTACTRARNGFAVIGLLVTVAFAALYGYAVVRHLRKPK